MYCPDCGASTKVVETRSAGDNTIRRRRQCVLDPSHSYVTLEMVAHKAKGRRGRVGESAQVLRLVAKTTRPAPPPPILSYKVKL